VRKEEEETVNKSPANSILFVEVDNNTNAAVYVKGLLMLFLFKNWVVLGGKAVLSCHSRLPFLSADSHSYC